jgi:hypothetical protein
MNPINLLITFIDGTSREVTAVVSDLMAFEDKFDKSVSDFAKGVRLSWLVWIAWKAESRMKQTELEFELYTDSIASVEVPEAQAKK